MYHLLRTSNITTLQTFHHLLKRTYVQLVCDIDKLPRYIHRPTVTKRSTADLRQLFVEHFRDHYQHTVVPSSSVTPKRNEGTYFINSGMNQFKPIFLGTVDPDSPFSKLKRAVNSQRCIRIGGKHNDLEQVGSDSYHHTFFEMLGNWSFGDYYKAEACGMMWRFLTEELHLPTENLYVTFFGGCKELGLPPDDETRDIWLRLGVSDKKLLSFTGETNFWAMGETGPCGPCTEIHFDHAGHRCARCFVNAGTPEVVELWNSVFVEYNRRPDGRLIPLPNRHVDTGMGLERLSAIVQGAPSNYDTDLFSPIISHLESLSPGARYAGVFPVATPHKLGFRGALADPPAPLGKEDASHAQVDTAYRIVADHLRTVSVAIADGMLPGRQGLELKLRHILQRALRQSVVGLGLTSGAMATAVPAVMEALNGVLPNSGTPLQKRIEQVIRYEEESFLPQLEAQMRSFEKCTKGCRVGHQLTEEQMNGLMRGDFGVPVNYDLCRAMAHDFKMEAPTPQAVLEAEAVNVRGLEEEVERREDLLSRLRTDNIVATDDSFKYTYQREGREEYEFSSCEARVVGLLVSDQAGVSATKGTKCALLLDKTSFYAESGGQMSDTGLLRDLNTQSDVFRVSDVQRLGEYVIHWGEVLVDQLTAGTLVRLEIDSSRRLGLMRHHTATHLLQWSLGQDLPPHDWVVQRGSSVAPNQLLLQMACLTPVTNERLVQVEARCRQTINADLPVLRTRMPLQEALESPSVRRLDDVTYPSHVTVVSLGDDGTGGGGEGAELCGGTHVHRTGDLSDLVVTSVTHGRQTVKELSAVVGQRAVEIRARGEYLKAASFDLEKSVRERREVETWNQRLEMINKMLGEEVLSKLDRDEVESRVQQLRCHVMEEGRKEEKTETKDRVRERIHSLTSGANGPQVGEVDFTNVRMVIKLLLETRPSIPLVLYHKQVAVCYVPEGSRMTSQEFAESLATQLNSNKLDAKPPATKQSLPLCYMLMGRVQNFADFSDQLEDCVKRGFPVI